MKVIRYIAYTIVFLLLGAMLLNNDGDLQAPESLLLNLGTLTLIMICLGFFSHKEWFRRYDKNLKLAPYIFSLFTIYFLFLLVDILLNRNILEWDKVYLFEHTLVAFTISILLAPIFEEIIFRGFLYNIVDYAGQKQKFISATYTYILPIIISSIIFGLVHDRYDFITQFQLILVGAILAFSKYKSGGLIVPILLHSCASILAFIVIYIKSLI